MLLFFLKSLVDSCFGKLKSVSIHILNCMWNKIQFRNGGTSKCASMWTEVEGAVLG